VPDAEKKKMPGFTGISAERVLAKCQFGRKKFCKLKNLEQFQAKEISRRGHRFF